MKTHPVRPGDGIAARSDIPLRPPPDGGDALRGMV
jgi:hypothetical protein